MRDQFISYNADSLVREHKGSCHVILLICFPRMTHNISDITR